MGAASNIDVMSARANLVRLRESALAVPAEMLERHGWGPGSLFEIDESKDALTFRVVEPAPPAPPRETITLAEFYASVPPHNGPPLSDDEIARRVEEGFRDAWAR